MESIGAMNPGEKTNPLRTFAICCKIWNHPDVLHKLHMSKDGCSEMDLDLPDFAPTSTTNVSGSGAPKKSKSTSSKSLTVANSSINGSTSQMSMLLDDQGGFNPFGNEALRRAINNGGFDPDWANRLMDTYKSGLLDNGAKFSVAFEIIKESVRAGDKILLFSQSLLSLNLIEEYLQRLDVPSQVDDKKSGEKWKKYKSYYR